MASLLSKILFAGDSCYPLSPLNNNHKKSTKNFAAYQGHMKSKKQGLQSTKTQAKLEEYEEQQDHFLP